MNEKITERVLSLIHSEGQSQTEFAKKCGLNYQNLNRYINGRAAWTDRALLKIADACGVVFKWLREGVGDMYRAEKLDGDRQYEELKDVLATPEDRIEELKRKIAALEAALEEKDKTIEILRDILKAKQ